MASGDTTYTYNINRLRRDPNEVPEEYCLPSGFQDKDGQPCRGYYIEDDRNDWTGNNDSQLRRPGPPRGMKRLSTIYDENHYALARLPSNLSDSCPSPTSETNKEDSSDGRKSTPNNCKIGTKCCLIIVISLLVTVLLGGGIGFSLFNTSGTENPPKKKMATKTTIQTDISTEIPIQDSTRGPIYGEWTTWSTWGGCSEKCGGGRSPRSRKCNSTNGGSICIGHGYQTKLCNENLCKEGSCCPHVTVHLTGPALEHQGMCKGDYIYYGPGKFGGDVYKSRIVSGIFIFKDKNGYWKFGKNYTSTRYHIRHPTKNCNNCPTECSRNWKYYNANIKKEKTDQKIELSCGNRKCCSKLKVSSTNQSMIDQQPESLGTYRYLEKDFFGGNIYKHIEYKRYLIRDHKRNVWFVSDKFPYGYGTEFLSKFYQDGLSCPELAQKRRWKYRNNNKDTWEWDETVKLTCLDYDLVSGHACKEGFSPLTRGWMFCRKAAEALGFSGDSVAHVDFKVDDGWGAARPQGCFQNGKNSRFHYNRGAGGRSIKNDKILCKSDNYLK